MDVIRVVVDQAAKLRGPTNHILVTPALLALSLLLLLPHFDPSISSVGGNMVVFSAPGEA
jgi:hypothetical protein